MDNPFPSCKSQILVHYALSIGVENDAIEENYALIHLGEICCACSPISGLFPHQVLTICLSFCYDKLGFLAVRRQPYKSSCPPLEKEKGDQILSQF